MISLNNNEIREALAIARKEILIDLRFSIAYLFQSIVSPLGRLIPILTVYAATVGRDAISPIPGISKETYLPFLALGIIFNTIWRESTTVFLEKFRRDKWARTIDLFFIAPIHTSAVITGIGISTIVQNIPTLLSFLIVLMIIYPTTIFGFSIAFLSFVLVTIIGLSIGLILGGAALSSENTTPFLTYITAAFTFLTPFFYPVEVIAKLPHPFDHILTPLIKYNPLNSALNLARTAWLGSGPVSILDLLYVLVTTLSLIFISGNIFRFIWRRFGLQTG